MHSYCNSGIRVKFIGGGGGGGEWVRGTLYIGYKTQLSSQMFPNERLTPETLIKTLCFMFAGYDEWLNCYAHL